MNHFISKYTCGIFDNISSLFVNSSSSEINNFNIEKFPNGLEIAGIRLKCIGILDEGAYSVVLHVQDLDNETKYFALKRVIVHGAGEQYCQIMGEVNFLQQLNPHDNIIKLYGTKFIKESKELFILMELGKDNLLSILQAKLSNNQSHSQYEVHHNNQNEWSPPKENNNTQAAFMHDHLLNQAPFTEAELLNIFIQICEAVGHMHSQTPPIQHRDLKLENILLASDNHYKLCDFGSATVKQYKNLDSVKKKKEFVNAEEDIDRNTTPAYRSPEMIDLYGNHTINEKADIWALGCMLYKLCYYFGPFEEGNKLQIINCKYSFPDEPVYSDDIIQLTKWMLTPDPEKRPNILEVIDRVRQLIYKRSKGKEKVDGEAKWDADFSKINDNAQ